MKRRLLSILLILVILSSLSGNVLATSQTAEQIALIYIPVKSIDQLREFASTQLPVYEWLEGGMLAGAEQAELQVLQEAGLPFLILDSDLRSGPYYLAKNRFNLPEPNYAAYGQVLLRTNNVTLLKPDPSLVDLLTQTGVELSLITLTPKPYLPDQGTSEYPTQVSPNPIIQGMIDQVTQEKVYQYDRQLAGELPVWVDGDWYTITSRYTFSGTPIQKTTQYIGQHMTDGLNLDKVEYQIWNNTTNPNVIGEITGLVNPQDIYIIGAHIDDVLETPGADDNASGSAATLLAADILSQYQWGCTLRFAFWTGEEQGLTGSFAYAFRAHNTGENILGYLNLDMIAWNTIGSDPYINLIYTNRIPATQTLAQLYADVIDAYDINLLPRLGTGISASDHTAFLQYGYPSILAIEDDLGDDINPYYHKPQDTPANTDPTYFTNFVKASIAAFAHLSDCIVPDGIGYLDGHITDVDGGMPIEAAFISASYDQAHNYLAKTDSNGDYARPLYPETYAVTAYTCKQYQSTITDVQIVAGSITTLDFTLQQCQKTFFPIMSK